MATPNPIRIVQGKGTLYADPTSLSAANYGGTPLGLVRNLEFRIRRRNKVNEAEEWGGAEADNIGLGMSAILGFTTRGFDPDVLNKLFDNTTAGTSSGERRVDLQAAGAIRAGYPGSSKSFKLLYAPDDADYGTFIVIFKAIPIVEEEAVIPLHLGEEPGIRAAFMGIPETGTGSKKAVASWGRREDISLTPA